MSRGVATRWAVLPIVCLLMATGCSREEAPEVTALEPAPDFTLRTLDGEPVRLADLRGKLVFVNLWATWCPPCRQELPSMVRFYKQYRDRGVEILAVSEDQDPAAVRRMVRDQGIDFPVLLDQDKRVYNLFGATGVPETYVINPAGFIEGSTIGSFDWTAPAVREAVDRILAAAADG